MILAVRILSFLVGVVLAASVLLGIMDIELFVVPDLVLSALLVVSSLLPKRWCEPALLAACGFASGVFTVATTRYILDGQAVNPPLVVMLAVVVFSMIALFAHSVRCTPKRSS